MEYRVKFMFEGFENNEFTKDILQNVMISDFSVAYNKMCELTNGGLIDKLNNEFNEKYPNYKIKDFIYDSKEYIDYFKKGYEENVLSVLNSPEYSDVLEFKIGSELELIGMLKINKNITISFVLEPIE